jgi:hypothetical protein
MDESRENPQNEYPFNIKSIDKSLPWPSGIDKEAESYIQHLVQEGKPLYLQLPAKSQKTKTI